MVTSCKRQKGSCEIILCSNFGVISFFSLILSFSKLRTIIRMLSFQIYSSMHYSHNMCGSVASGLSPAPAPGLLPAVVCRFFYVMGGFLLWSTGSELVMHRLSCSTYKIFPDQGSNRYLPLAGWFFKQGFRTFSADGQLHVKNAELVSSGDNHPPGPN